MTKALAKILISQHAVSTILANVQRDEARVRAHCSCPMVVDLGSGKRHVFFQGLWYRNVLVRTPEGWRIRELVEEGYWTHNLPTDLVSREGPLPNLNYPIEHDNSTSPVVSC